MLSVNHLKKPVTLFLMRIPKKYGESKVDLCPFCQKEATGENEQGVSVCRSHKENFLELKCRCGSWLDIRKGKFGAYCRCEGCGNQNLKRILVMTPVKNLFSPKEVTKPVHKDYRPAKKQTPKEITITSRDNFYF